MALRTQRAVFRGTDLDVIKGGETTPPTPDARDFAVWDGNRLVYTLMFFKTVGLAKERAAIPPVPAIPGAGGDREGPARQRPRAHGPWAQYATR
jgi:hypothetical protein